MSHADARSGRHKASWPSRPRLALVAGGIVLAVAVAVVLVAQDMVDGRALNKTPTAADTEPFGSLPDTTYPAAAPSASMPLASAPAATSAPGTPNDTARLLLDVSSMPSSTPSPPVQARTGSIVGNGGQCLTADLSNRGNGNLITASPCEATQNQTWTADANGTLRTADRCMRIGGDGMSPGSTVETWRCTSETSQQWRFTPDGALVNPATGLCLERPAGSPQTGALVRIAECAGAPEQQWTLQPA